MIKFTHTIFTSTAGFLLLHRKRHEMAFEEFDLVFIGWMAGHYGYLFSLRRAEFALKEITLFIV